MISPRQTRLVRVSGLRAFRTAIADLSTNAVIVVPTRAAAAQISIGTALTRDELYDHLHARLADPPRRLTAIERDVMAQAAARDALGRPARAGRPAHGRPPADGGPDPSGPGIDDELDDDDQPPAFQLRPGLVAEMLRFYDHLRRQSQQVSRFETLITDALGAEEIDRGARRMRRQTRFLAQAFRGYEARVLASSGCDEHTLRQRLLEEPALDPLRRIVVTVGDWIADENGLFVADYDLLSRIPGLETLDIIATESLLRSGLHERIHGWLPGIAEVEWADAAGARPRLLAPPEREGSHDRDGSQERDGFSRAAADPWWTYRDREEELVAVARRVKSSEALALERTAVVFKHPLPYLYLAADVFGAAGIPFRAFDALPLAAEPTSAAIDLVLESVSSSFTRDALIALLRSPHLVFLAGEQEISRESVSRLDRALSDLRYLGDLSRLQSLADAIPEAARPAYDAAVAAAQTLAPLGEPAPASTQLRRLIAFWDAHLRPIDGADDATARERRARAAVSDTIAALAAVHAAHDDRSWTIEDVALAVRRWIGEQTFETRSGADGLRLLDDESARYGDFDDVTIVGLVETEWPERSRRNIFYPPALLRSLGWASEKDRRAAADAHFIDLLGSASTSVTLSTFTLEDDSLVSRSLQLDEVPRARLSVVAAPEPSGGRVFEDEALSLDPASATVGSPETRRWADVRLSRTVASDARFHGTVASAGTRVWSVSALETYIGCPFRFFAQHVLKLEEEPDDEEVMDPRRQGQFVHDVFEQFFAEWQAAGHRGITMDNLDAARELFAAVVERAVERLPQAEAGLERTRLLGSSAAAGLGEAVMRMEAERNVPVVERLLEQRLDGSFTVATPAGPRTIALRGKADRLDLLDDGTFRVIDYKLGWPPDRTTALQLPIYALCAEQQLNGRRGKSWRLGEAAYIAFKGPRRIVPLFKSDDDRDEVLTKAQHRLAETIDRIAAGEFPPTPDDVYRCETCSYAGVCRKDYVGDV